MFDNYQYMGTETLTWETTGTVYHRLYRGGSNYYYTVDGLNLRWRLDLVFSDDYVTEYKNGFVASTFTEKDFEISHCKLSTDQIQNFLEWSQQ